MELSKHLAKAEPDLTDVIQSIGEAGVRIGRQIRRARLSDVIGALTEVNVQGEVQQKLDVLSDEILLDEMQTSESVGVYVSEEQPDAVVIRSRDEGGVLTVLADPLDGSSNIDVAVGVGTIFSVLRNDPEGATSALQPGERQIAAGYILYGSSTLLVLAGATQVYMYVLDPDSDEFCLVESGLRMPTERRVYSINEAYVDSFDASVQAYLRHAHGAGYAARYIGSMVADVHRTLLKGGVFLYPATADHPDGKLRLMYEANPMAWVTERAGGRAVNGRGDRILETAPSELHQRSSVILGSKAEVDLVTSFLPSGSAPS